VYNNVATNAEATACAATRRSIESAYQMYRAAGNSDTTDISKLVPGYLAEAPKCPGGGTYTLNSNGTVTCSEHNSAASSSSSSSSR